MKSLVDLFILFIGIGLIVSQCADDRNSKIEESFLGTWIPLDSTKTTITIQKGASHTFIVGEENGQYLAEKELLSDQLQAFKPNSKQTYRTFVLRENGQLWAEGIGYMNNPFSISLEKKVEKEPEPAKEPLTVAGIPVINLFWGGCQVMFTIVAILFACLLLINTFRSI